MRKAGFAMEKVRGFMQWFRIYMLYRAAFPVSERKPFRMIVSMARRGKTDVWYAESEGRFAGFASTINDESIILLDYLAVDKKRRGRGEGSRILQALKENYAGRGIFVEIESPFENVPERRARLRRKSFYVANGFAPAGVMADVFGVHMELLCWKCSMDFSAYHAFYRDNYSPWAAEHILPVQYPGEK